MRVLPAAVIVPVCSARQIVDERFHETSRLCPNPRPDELASLRRGDRVLNRWRAALVAIALVVANAAVAQDSVEAFYRGRTVTITVGSAVGGGYDAYARLIGRHLGRHIPGNPTVIVQNIAGAGSNKAASYVALQAPKDGTALGAVQAGAILQPLLSEQAVPQDPAKFIMLGSANRSFYLCLVRADAPVRTFAELFDRELIVGTSGEGATLRDFPVMLVNVLRLKLRLIGGYAGSREVMLALERNEVQGMCGMDWSSLATQQADWVSGGFVRLLAQEDIEGHPAMNKMGVPLTLSFARTSEERQIMEMIYSQNFLGRPYFAPPGVPANRVAALRTALQAALADKALLADAQMSGLDIDPMGGEELQALVSRLYALPPAIVARAKQALIYQPAR
jgi:tripartite-type tricarboxylate transporter receptor subunit TctC